jgi:hypothetical protein
MHAYKSLSKSSPLKFRLENRQQNSEKQHMDIS